MALTTQEIYDLCLIGGQWHLEMHTSKNGFKLSSIVHTLGELEYITIKEASALTKRIAKKGLPKPPVRLIFDRQIEMCLPRPGKSAHAAFTEAIEKSSKHLASLPGVNLPHLSHPSPITFPLYLTTSGRKYTASIMARYAASHGFTQERFGIAFAAQRERIAIIMAANRKRMQEKDEE